MKYKKGRTTKIYAINIERKRLLKQRREKVLQNAKDRKLAKRNHIVALQANRKANSASNDKQSITDTNDEIIDDNNTDDVIGAEKMDNAAIGADNTDNAAADGEKLDDATMSDNNSDNITTGNGNTDNTTTGETSTLLISLSPWYGGKTKDPSKIKTSTKCMPAIAEPSTGDPLPDDYATAKASGHTVDLTDVHMYEFLIQGTPNPCDLEGIEEDQLLEIQQNIQDKLKQRDEERERNITKRMKQYGEKYDFINKALLESVTHITEMTKMDHPMAAAKVQSADKMVMLPPHLMVANLKWQSNTMKDLIST